MSEEITRSWLSPTSAGFDDAVDALKNKNPDGLFVVLMRAAAGADWETFSRALERASGVTGIQLLLPAPDGFPMRYVYERTELPELAWPLFIAVLECAAAIARESGTSLRAGKQLRDLVLERAFAQVPPPEPLRLALLD